jgi:cytochrome c oxidase subunit 2
MDYLVSFGPRGDPVTALLWGLIWLSCFVTAVIGVLVLTGVLVRRRRGVVGNLADEPARRGPNALKWFYVGVPLTIAALLAFLVWTVGVLAAVDSPRVAPALTIEITGHQWWWEAHYSPGDPGGSFTTANEFHIPVGRPVRIRLDSPDVIHSFWIPQLSGKTDTIPGQLNTAWLQANRPGVYRGQCTEYCGLQHAHMGMIVIADPPAVFEAWRQDQLRPAAPAPPATQQGQRVFVTRCGACHTVRGTEAGGVLGPDLTHLMSRQALASEAVPNTVAGLSGWIANPQALKPGTKMPATWLSGGDLQAAVAYLRTLR